MHHNLCVCSFFLQRPAGTRIIYDRKFLLQCRTSPLTHTPPKMPDIPGVTRPLKPDSSRDAIKPEQTLCDNSARKLRADERAGTAFLESPDPQTDPSQFFHSVALSPSVPR